MYACDICSTLEEKSSVVEAEILQELRSFISDPLCETLIFCSNCRELIHRTGKFIRAVKQACLRYSEIGVKSEQKDSLEIGVWEDNQTNKHLESNETPKFEIETKCERLNYLSEVWEDNTVTESSEDEKPLKLLETKKYSENSIKLENGVKIKKKKHKSKRKKSAEDTELPESGSLKLDLLDASKPKKDGRRVVETQEYVVIRLTLDQVREEMSSRAATDQYKQYPYRCDDCVKGFNYPDVMMSHKEKHNESNGPFRCVLCNQYTSSAVSHRGHMKSHLTRYKCKTCGVIKSSRQLLLEHAATHTDSTPIYTCERCGHICTRRTALQKHMRSHNNTQPLACDVCGRKFKSIETLRVHSVKHMGGASVRRAPPPRRDYCVECDASVSSLKKHLSRSRRHSNAQYGCTDCHKLPRSGGALVCACGRGAGGARVRAHRERGRTLACSYCNNTFKTRNVLVKHLRTHTGERPYECAECGHRFTQSSTRATHIRLVHRKLPRKVHPDKPKAVYVQRSENSTAEEKGDKCEAVY